MGQASAIADDRPSPIVFSAVLIASQLTVLRDSCQVVEGFDLTVAAGEIVALVGPNGAGKSTVLRALLGLLPYHGSVTIDGLDVQTLDARQRAKRVGYVPQRSQLAAAMDVRNVVALGRFAHHGLFTRLSDTDGAAVDAALVQTDAKHLADRLFTQLSVGEQQRVLLARAVCSGARIVLLDEPTAALDVGHTLALLALLRDLAAHGHALVVVLHDLDQVATVADRVLLLHQGRTVASGPVGEVLTATHLLPVFGVEPVAGGAWGFRRP